MKRVGSNRTLSQFLPLVGGLRSRFYLNKNYFAHEIYYLCNMHAGDGCKPQNTCDCWLTPQKNCGLVLSEFIKIGSLFSVRTSKEAHQVGTQLILRQIFQKDPNKCQFFKSLKILEIIRGNI